VATATVSAPASASDGSIGMKSVRTRLRSEALCVMTRGPAMSRKFSVLVTKKTAKIATPKLTSSRPSSFSARTKRPPTSG
jgi:hypothetical protein